MEATDRRFDQAVSSLCGDVSPLLIGIPGEMKKQCYEVRMRIGQPLSLVMAKKSFFIEKNGAVVQQASSRCHLVDKGQVDDSVISLCARSIHSHQHEFTEGYISVRGGHRAGVCGVAVADASGVAAVRDICSINLRIARQIPGAADEVIRRAFGRGIAPILLAGPPSSGKTTILRDLARQLSGGALGSPLKISVIDERCELGAVFEGIPQNDLGPCTDLLSGYPKALGIGLAVRTLSPEYILCDEIGGVEEARAMLEGLNAGVGMIATAHAGSIDELFRRDQICLMLNKGVFDKVVLLEKAGRIKQIIDVREQYDKADRHGSHSRMLLDDRQGVFGPHGKAGFLD